MVGSQTSVRRDDFSPIAHLRKATLLAGMDDVGWTPGPAAKFGSTVIAEGLVDLFIGVHHEGSVLGHGF